MSDRIIATDPSHAVTYDEREIDAYCKRYSVQRLALINSGMSDAGIESDTGVLNFLVEFQPLSAAARADAYFGVLWALRNVFRRPISLVDKWSVENLISRKTVEQTRTTLYEA